MNTVLIIATAILAVVMAGLIGINVKRIDRLTEVSTLIAKQVELTQAYAKTIEMKAEYPKKEISVISDAEKSNASDIDKILQMLTDIIADIHRLDERTETDHRDLVDIRTRYVNFREPVNNGGVTWASNVKCEEDHNG